VASYFAKKIFKQIRANIITGVFILIPALASIFIIVKLFVWSDSTLQRFFGTHWPLGVGLLVALFAAYIVGLAAKHWIGRRIIATGNAIIVSIPFINKIYLVIKQVIDTITVDKKKLFERAVLLEFPRKESFVIGLVTSENNEKFSVKAGRKLVSVFVPKVPNPTTGFLLYVPEEDLINLDIPIETALKLVVSAGLIGTAGGTGEQKLPQTTKHWNWMDIFRGKRGWKKKHHLNDPRD
jgi:uncharacterized membrane protein